MKKLKIVFLLVGMILFSSCAMDSSISDESLGKFIQCTDIRDGEQFSFYTDSVKNEKRGILGPSSFDVRTTDGKLRHLSTDMAEHYKCQEIAGATAVDTALSSRNTSEKEVRVREYSIGALFKVENAKYIIWVVVVLTVIAGISLFKGRDEPYVRHKNENRIYWLWAGRIAIMLILLLGFLSFILIFHF